MSEVVTDKDREYEALEAAAAPGAEQPNADRVNNRTLRPTGETFKQFMTTGWDDQEPEIEPLESSKYIQARIDALGAQFPGERIVIPAGTPKVRQDAYGRAVRGAARRQQHRGVLHLRPVRRVLGRSARRSEGAGRDDRPGDP